MSETKTAGTYFRFLLRAIAIWLVSALVLCLCVTIVYAADGVSLSTLGYASSLISFLSAVLACIGATGAKKDGRLLSGALCGVVLSALLVLIGFLIKGKLNVSSVLSSVSFTLSGMLVGSMIPLKRKRKRGLRMK